MKKIFIAISISALFAACQTQDKGSLEIKKESIPLDTTGLYRSNANADTAKIQNSQVTTQQKTVQTTTVQQPAPPKVVYRTRTIVHENTRYLPAPKAAPASQTTTTVNTPSNPPVNNGNTGSTTSNGTGNYPSNGSGTANSNGTGNNYPNNGGIVPAHPAPAKTNRGWSDAAKDATIGGVGGAVGGAVLSRNKGKGALIGGIIGAAGGYILGRKKDKQNNRDSVYK